MSAAGASDGEIAVAHLYTNAPSPIASIIAEPIQPDSEMNRYSNSCHPIRARNARARTGRKVCQNQLKIRSNIWHRFTKYSSLSPKLSIGRLPRDGRGHRPKVIQRPRDLAGGISNSRLSRAPTGLHCKSDLKLWSARTWGRPMPRQAIALAMGGFLLLKPRGRWVSDPIVLLQPSLQVRWRATSTILGLAIHTLWFPLRKYMRSRSIAVIS
jgi:hypothetical protein